MLAGSKIILYLSVSMHVVLVRPEGSGDIK